MVVKTRCTKTYLSDPGERSNQMEGASSCFSPSDEVFRPSSFLKAEELIKEEMLTMLHYDNLHNPPATQLAEAAKQASAGTSGAVSQRRYMQQMKQVHEGYLREHTYTEIDPEDLAKVSGRSDHQQ